MQNRQIRSFFARQRNPTPRRAACSIHNSVLNPDTAGVEALVAAEMEFLSLGALAVAHITTRVSGARLAGKQDSQYVDR